MNRLFLTVFFVLMSYPKISYAINTSGDTRESSVITPISMEQYKIETSKPDLTPSKNKEEKTQQGTQEKLLDTLDKATTSLYKLYNRELRKDPNIRGAIRFKIFISELGQVMDIEILSSEIDNTPLVNKIKNRMALIDFGELDSIYKIEWALKLEPK